MHYCELFICLFFVFFFFQAEDGIRDYKVTGVQTCALPICSGVGGSTARLWWYCPCNRGTEFNDKFAPHSSKKISLLFIVHCILIKIPRNETVLNGHLSWAVIQKKFCTQHYYRGT